MRDGKSRNPAEPVADLLDVLDREAGMALEEGDFDLLFDAVRGASADHAALAGAVARIVHRLAALPGMREVGQFGIAGKQQRLAGIPVGGGFAAPGQPGVQACIEQDRQLAVLGHRLAAGDARGRPGQGDEAAAGDRADAASGKFEDGAAMDRRHGALHGGRAAILARHRNERNNYVSIYVKKVSFSRRGSPCILFPRASSVSR